MVFGTIFFLLLIAVLIFWLLLKNPDNENVYSEIHRTAKATDEVSENTHYYYVDEIQLSRNSSSNTSKLLVPKKGSYQEVNYINTKTGRFKMYKPPQTKSYLVRIKDSTDYITELFDDLDKEEKARFSIRDFESRSEYIDYEFEIDSFDEMYEKLSEKRRKQLWPYDFDLLEIIEEFEDDYDFEVPSKYLTKEQSNKYPDGFIKPINYQEHEIELWDQLKVPRLKELCKESNISITNKKKATLVESLSESGIQYPSDIKFPYELTDDLKAALQPIIDLYIGEMRKNIDRFHPLQIRIIWEQASEVDNSEIVNDEIGKVIETEYWTEKLREVDYVDYVTKRVS